MNRSRDTLQSLYGGYKHEPRDKPRKQRRAPHGDAVARREAFFDLMEETNTGDLFQVCRFLKVSQSTVQNYRRLWKLAKKMLAAGDTVPEIAMACKVSEEYIRKMKARNNNGNHGKTERT